MRFTIFVLGLNVVAFVLHAAVLLSPSGTGTNLVFVVMCGCCALAAAILLYFEARATGTTNEGEITDA